MENRLTVPAPVEEAWRVLLDIERVTPCVPGATLTSRDGDSFQGRIKVKLGPVGLTYHGTVTFLSRDEADRTVVLEAGGREIRGNGTAKARVTCRLVASGTNSTDVLVDTDLAITGKPAQFGRGTLAEVAGTLIGRFAENLAAELAVPAPDPTAEPVLQPVPAPDPLVAEPINLIEAAGGGALKRIVPPATVLLLLALLVRGRRRTHR
ncbi:SRPBCC family protein [Streptomyces sp. NPDC001002]